MVVSDAVEIMQSMESCGDLSDSPPAHRVYSVMRNLAIVTVIAVAIGVCALGILAFAWLFPYGRMTAAIFYALCLGCLAFLDFGVLFIGGLMAIVLGYAMPCRSVVLPSRGKQFFAYVLGFVCVMFQLATVAAVVWIVRNMVSQCKC